MKQAFAGMKNIDEALGACVRAGSSGVYQTKVRVDCVFKRLVIGSDSPVDLAVVSLKVVCHGAVVATLHLNVGDGPMPATAFRSGFTPEQIAFGDAEAPITFDEPLSAGDVVELVILNLDNGSGHITQPGLIVELP